MGLWGPKAPRHGGTPPAMGHRGVRAQLCRPGARLRVCIAASPPGSVKALLPTASLLSPAAPSHPELRPSSHCGGESRDSAVRRQPSSAAAPRSSSLAASWSSCTNIRGQCCIPTTRPPSTPSRTPYRGCCPTTSTRGCCPPPRTTGRVRAGGCAALPAERAQLYLKKGEKKDSVGFFNAKKGETRCAFAPEKHKFPGRRSGFARDSDLQSCSAPLKAFQLWEAAAMQP